MAGIPFVSKKKEGGMAHPSGMKETGQATVEVLEKARPLGVLGGHVAGAVGGAKAGGPAGGVAGYAGGGIAGGAAMDGVTSGVDTLVHQEYRPHGYVKDATNIVSNPTDADGWTDAGKRAIKDGTLPGGAGPSTN